MVVIQRLADGFELSVGDLPARYVNVGQRRVVIAQSLQERFERPSTLAIAAPLFSLGGAGKAAHDDYWLLL